MFSPEQYALLDFGAGRRLERFGELVLDRPCPTAEGCLPANPGCWAAADARFDRGDGSAGQWSSARPLPERWTITAASFRFELKRTEFGHLGLFPEQAENWPWIADQVRGACYDERPAARVLNLFAYTGGSTLAAALAGAEVTHVDAARNVVAWARGNAERSALADRPIRWIAEDALKFVQRALRRGERYEAVILDPPSYGHGPRGEVWQLSKHLPQLLELCAELTAASRRFMLLTCHTPGYDVDRLERLLDECVGRDPPGTIDGEAMSVRAQSGRSLPSGVCVRWRRAPGKRAG